MDKEKELDNIADADLWALKASELIAIQRGMNEDSKFSKEEVDDMDVLIRTAVNNMEHAINEERNGKEGKTK